MSNDSVEGLRVEVLGPVQAIHGGVRLELGQPRQLAVFAALGGARGALMAIDDLVSAVWGASPPSSARGSVYTYISGLRRCLGAAADTLESSREGYRLVLPPDALDVTLFDRLCERAESLTASGASAEVVSCIDKALSLWRGDPYSGLPGPFAEHERDRLVERYFDARERRLATQLDLGTPAPLIADLTTLVNERPLRESLRVLLMRAYCREGRHAEALEVFHDARRALLAELGVAPGPELCRMQELVLRRDCSLNAPESHVKRDSVLRVENAIPAAAVRGTADFVGRRDELATLATLVEGVVEGTGHSVWLEGPAGIGKTELLARAFAGLGSTGCGFAWAAANPLGSRFPLQVMVECLGVDARSTDARRSALARRMAEGDGPGDPIASAVEGILSLVDELCAEAPLVLVVDDIHWADEASLLVWHRLSAAARQLPLLLVASARPAHRRRDLTRLRHGVESREHTVLTLSPLSLEESCELAGRLAGGVVGASVQRLAELAAGNPLYLQETVEAMVRSGTLTVIGGVADIDPTAASRLPKSVVAAVGRTLIELSVPTRELLSLAALLGPELSVTDLCAVLGRPVAEVAPMVEEAVGANVLVDAGANLTFRHPLLRQVLCDGVSRPARTALHRQAAEVLAGVGAPVRIVAEQLIAAAPLVDPWISEWLVGHRTELANQAPLVAADLLRQVLAARSLGRAHREILSTALVRVLYRLNRAPESEARQALALVSDPAQVAELRQLLAAMLSRRGQGEWAEEVLVEALADPRTPHNWRIGHGALLANVRRGDLSDPDRAEPRAREIYAAAVAGGEPYPLAHALQTLWHIDSMRRDHGAALRHVDEALAVASDRPELRALWFDLLDNRVFTLHNLDRLVEAERVLASANEFAVDRSLPSGLQVSTAIHHYWSGEWDASLVELAAITEDSPTIAYQGVREPGPVALLLHGVAALIAGRREDRATAERHLAAAESYLPATRSERECYDFLLVAQSLAAEQQGDRQRAFDLLAPILTPSYSRMMLRHQWLPDAVRLAMMIGDRAAAEVAADACDREASAEAEPARAYAALLRCRGYLHEDVDSVGAAVEHYAKVGRRIEQASALEDLAELHAKAGRRADALAALHACIDLYTAVGARWDIGRAEERASRFGVVRTRSAAFVTPDSGWQSLSPVEIRIALLVARGRSNPEIARELPMARRTVQAYVTRILRKVRADSRAALAEQVAKNLPSGVGRKKHAESEFVSADANQMMPSRSA